MSDWLDKYSPTQSSSDGDWLDKYAQKKFDPTKAPQMNALGRAVDPLIESGKTAVGTILSNLGRFNNAKNGAIVNGLEGAKEGFLNQKDYSGEDVMSKFGWEGDGLGKKAAGLAFDLGTDPLNLVGVGEIKALGKTINVADKYQAGVKALGKGALAVAEKTPVVGAATKAVGSFLDPFYHLKDTPEARDFFRIQAKKSQAALSNADQIVADTIAPKGASVFARSLPEEGLKKVSYALENPNLALSPEEQIVRDKAKKVFNDRFYSEMASGHQNPNAYIPNYVPHTTVGKDAPRNISLMPDVKGTTRFAKTREVADLGTAVKNYGATDNIADILNARVKSGLLAQHGANLVEEAGSKFAIRQAQDGYRQLNPRYVSLPSTRGTDAMTKFYPNAVADEIEKVHTLYNKPDEVLNTYKKIVQVYKSALVATPQQIGTNFIGNVFNSIMTGNTPSWRNMKLSVPIVIGGKIPPDITTKAGKVIKGSEVLDKMKELGVVGNAGQYHDLGAAGKNWTANPLKPNFVYNKGMQFLNQHAVEEPFRVAQFLQKVEDGESFEKAALSVDDTFFNYGEVSPAVKAIRDSGLAPFITWQTKNIPLQLKNIALNPQKYSKLESVINSVSDPNQIQEHQDIREGLIPTGDGKGTRMNLPIFDLNKLPIGEYGIKDLATDTIGQSVPWIKAIPELWAGKKIYNDSKIWNDEGVIPFDVISQLLMRADNKLGTNLEAAAGISNETGVPRQNDLMAYILQQNPWQYYGRNFLNPPQELIDKGTLPELTLGKIGRSAFGIKQKETSPQKQVEEMKRRMKLVLEP